MAKSSSLSFSSGHQDMAEIFQLLESNDSNVLDETTALVRDNLGSVTEPWLLNGLVDFYIQSGNTFARELLCIVRQRQHKALLSKIDDYLQKVSTRLKALILLGHIIRSDPVWVHHVPGSKTFQSVLKCLQVDTDIPTITSAIYIIATIMPKIASQLTNYLQTICTIFVRLVSWHTIKPAGANESNLIHLHTAVYALFLCLYSMFPCYFVKYLQQYFQSGSTSKGNVSEKEKLRIFENSVMPMLEQVRLNSHLISDSADFELSNEKWRKLECCDIVTDISKITLDASENSAAVVSRTASTSASSDDLEVTSTVSCTKASSSNTTRKTNNYNEDGSIWSPSVAIGLSTPPASRAMSPTPVTELALDPNHESPKYLTQQSSDQTTPEDSEASDRPLFLNVSGSDAFVPHRPHLTASAASTPLKHLSPSFVFTPPPSGAQSSSPKADADKSQTEPSSAKKTDKKSSKNPPALQVSSHLVLSPDQNIDDAFVNITCTAINTEDSSGSDIITEFTPGLQPSQEQSGDKEPKQEVQEEPFIDKTIATSARKMLDLKDNRTTELSPSELLNLHCALLADAYTKYRNIVSLSNNKDVEWRVTDTLVHQPSPAVNYLRNEVVQMHCAMLYEQHRAEKFDLRARKLMRKLYDTTDLELRLNTLTFHLAEQTKENEQYKTSEKLHRLKIKQLDDSHVAEVEYLQDKVKSKNEKIEEMTKENRFLKQENERIKAEYASLKKEADNRGARLWSLEQKQIIKRYNKQEIDRLEDRVQSMQMQLFNLRETNCCLQDQLREARGYIKAKAAETKVFIKAYEHELKTLKEKTQREGAQLNSANARLRHAEAVLQRKDNNVEQLKQYLENVKSLARGQIQAIEAKYTAQKHILLRMEVQLVHLFSKVTAYEGEMANFPDQFPNRPISTPQSIQVPPDLPSQIQQEPGVGFSPQLSPPMRSAMLPDKPLWCDDDVPVDDVTPASDEKIDAPSEDTQ